ncbi:MAG: OmpW family outer membrane protein [Candidatus Aminicenantaceae bacterium]
MNKCGKFFTLSVCLLILSAYGFSYGPGNTFFFGLTAYIPSENQIKTGYGSGLGTTFMLTQNVVFSLEFKYGRFSVDPEEGKFLAGNLTLTPIVANFQYFFNPNSNFSPYVFGGACFVFASFKTSAQETEEDAIITRQSPKDGLGFQGGFGATYNVTEQLAIYFEGYYLYRKTVVETSFLTGATGQFDTNLSHLGVVVGLKYYY